MSTAILGTASRVDDADLNVQTGEMRADDWVLPEIEPEYSDSDESTSTEPGTGSPRATTFLGTLPRVSTPIRRDCLTIRLSDDHIKLLQQWECIISGVHDDWVECEMHDLTDEMQPVEHAEVYLEEFNHFDRALLQEGAVFYWSIGHVTSKTGQVRRYSDLRVRRMPRLSNLRKREITQRAEYLSGLLEAKDK